MIAISIDGADNVGKTTQIGLLPRDWTIVTIGSLHKYDERMAQLVLKSELKGWWWSCDDEEFVTVIFDALASRRELAESRQEAKVTIYDRGTKMFEAVAAATISVKNGFETSAQGRLKLEEILKKRDITPLHEDVSILLKHHRDMSEAIRIGLAREVDPVDQRYKQYQKLLHQELQHQEKAGKYHHVHIEEGPKSHLVVQDQIRQDLATYALPKLFTPVLANVRTLYAIGGLSESGKSTIAAKLAASYGQKANRMKIGYLLDVASGRLRGNVYDLPEKDQAYAILNEIQAYSQAHYWLQFLTIESVHRYESLRWLKTWLGAKMQIIYVDAPRDVRHARNAGSQEEFSRKDQVKLSRGADRIKEIADFVLDNSTEIDVAVRTLLAFTQQTFGSECSWSYSTVSKWPFQQPR